MSTRLDHGRNGFEEVTGSSSGGPYHALMPVGGEATLSATTVSGFGDDLSSATIAEGVVIVGRFDSVTVTSGTVLAYHENQP